jgi:UDP:flavonoid glycosyltransferase YjiC (YdhE family)
MKKNYIEGISMEKEAKKFGSDFSSITPDEYEKLVEHSGLELSEVPAYEVEEMLEDMRDKKVKAFEVKE